MKSDLEKILEYGLLAPSSHNSQPWKVSIRDNTIRISPDLSRSLLISDKNNRQLFISLGCMVENILQASNALGYDTDYEIEKIGNVLIRLEKITVSNELLLEAIQKRVTNRSKYIDSKMISDMKSFIDKLNFSSDLKFFVTTDNSHKKDLADIAVNASVDAMNDKDFRVELSRYVKNNLTKSRLGIPAYGMGIPTVVSFVAPFLIRFININKKTARKDFKILESTPALVTITTKHDGIKSWVEAGIAYERIALKAEKLGLSTAMWAAPIQIKDFYKSMKKVLNTDFRPVAFFRLGEACRKTKPSPRLSLNEVLK